MYLLTGDLDHDRHGGPIIHNFDDTFMLSRDETIFDVLEKHGVSWRVYESFPSVATLRMFARYATDHEHIRPLDQLEADVVSGNLPAFTSVEPAMHHSPQDDDHPDADMWRGQQFIHRVYKALRSNPDTWAKTLLIITYDEHGGLYDHVVPPAAEVVFSRRIGDVEVGEDGASGGASGEPIVGGAMSDGSQNAGSGGQPGPGEPGTGNPPGAPGTIHLAGWGHRVTMDHPDVTDFQGAPAAAPPPPSELVIPYGLRVPTFVVSPWVQPGKGPSIVLDHCSIIKTVLARFIDGERPFLSERVAGSLTFEEFLTAPQARADIPLPDRPQEIPIEDDVAPATTGTEIVTPLFSVSRLRDHEVDYHDMSGWMARTILGR
jgi:phospholipase C